jgi:hypothetical protein
MTLRVVRIWLPAVVVAGGLVVMAVGGEGALEGGFGIIGAGLSVWLINFLYRVGVKGDRERDAEAAAREYFDKHGRWPDEGSR